LGGAINSLDPDIKLAARFSTDKSNTAVNTTTSSDDDQEADEFVSLLGFELIDGDNGSRGKVLDSDDDSAGEPFPLPQTIPTPAPLLNSSPFRSLGQSVLS
jgi:hypothetical protein